MDKILFIITIIIVFVLILIILHHQNPYIAQSFFSPPTPTKPCSDHNGPLILPLIYNRRQQFYTTKITLGDPNKEYKTVIEAVPDTGSTKFILSGSDCEGCDPTDGVWDTRYGTQLSSYPRQVTYGGGQVSTYYPWRGYLYGYKNSSGQPNPKEIDFGLVYKNRSPFYSPENVIGLQPKSDGFFSSLCGEKSLLFDFPNNKLVIGDLDNYLPGIVGGNGGDSHKRVITFGMFTAEGSVPFIIGKVKLFQLIDTLNKRIDLPYDLIPRRVIFDTGTTQTLVRPELYRYLKRYNETETNDIVAIDFQFQEKRLDNIRDDILFPVDSRFLDLSESHILKEGDMLIGSGWLRRYGVGFDYDREKIIIVEY